jgi:hypothetical protein
MPKKNEIPKTIWMLWYQGFHQAPMIVKNCHESWRRFHPEWDIRMLDEHTLKEHMDVAPILEKNRDTISLQKISNIVRLNLLARYGGVWADATCFCMRTLDEWLENAAPGGFFAFQKPGKDRLLANWFLASSRDNYLVRRMNEEHNRFFMHHRFENEKKQSLIWLLSKILNRNVYLTRFWFSYPILRLLKVHPYFCFHYMFANLVRKDREFRAIWDRVEKISADDPHLLQLAGLNEPATESVRRHIDRGQSPVYKLRLKPSPEKIVKGSVLDYLFNRSSFPPAGANCTRKG